jgi:murein L,D-transpeptidase YcbB/YkuD
MGHALIASISRGAVLMALLAACAAQAQSRFDARSAREAVALLAQAATHGLEAADYAAAALADRVARSAGPPDAALDRDLHDALRRYLADLHAGRVRPREIEHAFAADRLQPRFDPGAALDAALALGELALAVRQAAPALQQYEHLREALARYRTLAAHAAWREPLPALPRAGRVEPGQAWAGVPLLAQRLQALGDAATGSAPPAYDAALAAAVRSFQQRHGLADDGVIGRATWAALQVTPTQRVRQLELALERLRWTPLRQAERMVVVNLPEFVLRAYEVGEGGAIRLRHEMKVIVGQALDTRTPLVNEAMRRIEFQPYWNVPASIARKELLPWLRRDAAAWAREGFEFVARDGTVDAEFARDKLDAVLAGALRIRQRPGPRNPLGDIKFVFPNRESIYLHHTPATALFDRARRDFSHGCIRVEDPLALARFALAAQPDVWTDERIRDAMGAARPSSVTLARPLPVLIAYGTALVKGGRVHFFDDLYGHDRTLDAALRARSRATALLTLQPETAS